MANKPLEIKLELWACAELRKAGCIPLKGKQDNCNDWPDRLVLCKDQHFFWIEFKRYGESPRPAQVVKFRQLREKGQHVYVCDTSNDVVDCMTMEGL